ncbi:MULTISPECIES: ABC-three component system middle component 2 [unclassified Streptomyces]|uniref:ABC-three component system middle component 2 n=1 Tax=unclassified Streptomyces TaxID=2593676 RepID=UPI002E0DF41C|nr:threonine transporter [Streptomyces sp. NBC_01197]WSS49037.1 threonine transporter [Streptomyces sp. NBC_01180]
MNPLNSPLEIGVRALVLLAESHPQPLDLAQLAVLDHAVLHSGDHDGPPSLHPSLPGHSGELGMKRTVLEQALLVLIRAGLAGAEADETGLVYRATDRGPAFVDILETPYVGRLRERAKWAVHQWAPGIDVREATAELVNGSLFASTPGEGHRE